MIKTVFRKIDTGMQYLTNRDRSKWYTFSKLDIALFVISGICAILSPEAELKRTIYTWLFVICANCIITFLHNLPKKDRQ